MLHGERAGRALPAASDGPVPRTQGEAAAAERTAAQVLLQGYMFLVDLQGRNERLFCKSMIDNFDRFVRSVLEIGVDWKAEHGIEEEEQKETR